MTTEMTSGHAAGWVKLHHINLRVAAFLGTRLTPTFGRKSRMGRNVQHVPPQDVVDTCEILAKGTETEIKARINWLRIYYPAQFNELT